MNSVISYFLSYIVYPTCDLVRLTKKLSYSSYTAANAVSTIVSPYFQDYVQPYLQEYITKIGVMGCVHSTYKDPSTPVAKQLRNVNKEEIPTVFHQNKEIYARIIKVYDGDTCTALVVVGTQPIKIRLRLAHIDTPEMRDDPTHTRSVAEKRLAIAARDRLADLILEKIVPIKILKWDKYGGRVVTEIYVTVNGKKTTASQILLDEGYAQPYEGGRKAEWTL